MANNPELADLLTDLPCILDPYEVAAVLQVSISDVRRLAANGAFEIFRPEADPDEECVLRADLLAYLSKNVS